MNKLITSIIFALTVTSVDAQTHEDVEECNMYASLAETFMTARQRGLDLEELAEDFKQNKIALKILNEAYEKPLYGSRSNKQQAISLFKQNQFINCVLEKGK